MIKEFLSKGRQRSMVLVSFLMFAATVFAVPAKPGITRLLTLTDGTTVTATLVGDEFAHYWIDSNGHAYQSVSGDVYQMIDLQAVKQHAAKRRAAANQRRMRRLASRRIGEVGGITGDKKGLIILVNFSDVKFDGNHNNALFQDIANKENFTSGNFKGSMYDYFKAQSDGKFLLTFDVVGPVDISKPQAYYGENKNGERGEDLHAAEMVIEALQKVDSEVNFANYDWDGDKEVEQVYVVYAGKGEADGGAANTIWPHEYDLASAKYFGDGTGLQILDGVKINTYACGSELNGSGNICGIGTMCHEFSHCLGYPDFYDTDYSGGQGMGQWDLMCSGSYNGNGYQPAGYTSYERWVAGWKTPVTLGTTQTVSNMKALQTKNSDTYIIYNKGNNNEYYLLENRQKTGWDASLPGAGLLILHVDYDKNAWSNNNPNDDPDHQRMTWIPADNDYNSNPANDPFPYGSANAFGKNTTPAARLYNKNSDGSYYLDCSIKNITQNSDGTVTFDFNGESNLVGAPAAPTDLKLSAVASTSFTAKWSVVTNADSYEIDIAKGSSFSDSPGEPVLQTGFASTTGWTFSGTGTYTGAGYYGQGSPSIKFDGTGDYAISPDFGSGVKLQFWAYGNGGSESSFAISGLVNGNWTDIETVTVAQGGATYEVNLPAGTSQIRFDFTKSVNCALDDVVVYGPGNSSGSVEGYPKSIGNVTSYDVTGLSTETEYAVRVRAVNSDGNSEWSTVATATTAATNIAPVWSALPANVSVTIGEDYELMVSDYVSGIPTPTITMTSSDSDDADFDDGYFLFIPTTAGTFNFTFRATNTEGSAKTTLTVTVPAPPAGKEFTLVTSANDFVEGDYIIVYNNGAMNTTVSNNRLQYTEVTPNSDVITTDDASIIWHIKPSGNYYTIYNAKEKKYAAGTGTKSQAQLLDSDTDDKALWSVTKGTTFDFTNKYNSSKNVNATLRRNGTYGFACYASGTGGKLSLYKCPTPLLLANDGDNSSTIAAAANGGKYDVTLNNRTLYKDGSWNTLCLPFDISSSELDDADNPLHGSTIMALDVESKEDDGQTPKTRLASDGTLYLYFQTVYDYFFPSAGLTAGTPYLVKWDKADGYDQASENTRDLKNPVFSGVTIKNATTEVNFTGGKFKGLFSPENFTANDESILYFGAGNKLHWPNANMTLGACRAYFLLNDGNEARDFVVIFNDNEATGIASHLLPLDPCPSEWYTVNGMKLSGKPTQKGLYIHNGRKTVIK